MKLVYELWSFLRLRKKFWLLPLLMILILCGLILTLTYGTAIAPFIYALF